jgi:hypothetical protein
MVRAAGETQDMQVGILLFKVPKKVVGDGQGIQVNDQYPDWFSFQMVGQTFQGIQRGDRDLGLLQQGAEFQAILDISSN